MQRLPLVVVFLLGFVVLSCGRPVQPTGQQGQAGVQLTEVPVDQPTEEPADQGLAVPAEAQEVVEASRTALLARLGQPTQDVELLAVEPAEWSDAAMGCPEPDKMYAQVLTSGYVIRWKVGDDIYEIHATPGGQMVFCGLPAEEATTQMNVPTAAEPLVKAVQQDLASRLGLDPSAVEIVEVEAVDWPDSSLGCPEPGKMYMQVITPGYRVMVKSDNQIFEYHTDLGKRVVLCGEVASEKAVGAPKSLQLIRDAVTRARADLGKQLDVDPASVMVSDVRPLEAGEKPAGCPQVDQLSGSEPVYQIVLQVEGQKYVYLAQGEELILCTR